jgi:hypothetical protein
MKAALSTGVSLSRSMSSCRSFPEYSLTMKSRTILDVVEIVMYGLGFIFMFALLKIMRRVQYNIPSKFCWKLSGFSMLVALCFFRFGKSAAESVEGVLADSGSRRCCKHR